MADIKNCLYAWCGKRKVTPNYDVRATGNKNRQKFTCEVRVEGFNYTAMGNSTNKKDAQANAARDYVNYLVCIGEASMSGADVSIDPGGGCGFGTLPPNAPLPPHLAVKNEADVEPGPSSGPVPGGTGLGYSNFSGPQWERGAILNNYYSNREEQEAQATLESEEVDLNASLHGNWTPENAKARLNQFFQKEKNQADYKYSQVGPDHNRSFIAEMSVFVRQLGRTVCVIYILMKKKEGETMEVYEVNIANDLARQLETVMQELGLQIPPLTQDPSYPVSLTQGKIAHFEPSQRQSMAGVVPWSPPQVIWHPWTSRNIDDGPLAFCTPEQINIDLQNELMYQMEQDKNLQQIISEREQLPVKKFEQEIMQVIHNNQVVIIRGATGCGKTTQVPQYILDEFIKSGKASDCNVVTQPQRISAVSVAERFAYERSEEVGKSCGYSVRFESVLPRPHASMLFCTVEYFLEDSIQMTQFVPPPDKDEEGGEETNCNIICCPEYGPETKRSMAQINEKETPFELIEALLKYIETLKVPGAVLAFLRGWNLIYSMQRHLEMSPHFVILIFVPTFHIHIRTRAMSAKGMTLVSALQLLLFASKKVTSDGEIILLDEWIKLKMSHNVAACTTALRTGMEAVVVEISKDPEYIRQMDPINQRMLNVIRKISKPSATGFNLMVNNSRIKLKMSHNVAACTTALRTGMEAVVVEISKDPEYIRQMDPINQRMLNVIRKISKPSATGFNLIVNNSR
ncbi:UNVERIFIED_CONTAM: hypothetical protein FKN15_003760 [Acipenser sinensis]